MQRRCTHIGDNLFRIHSHENDEPTVGLAPTIFECRARVRFPFCKSVFSPTVCCPQINSQISARSSRGNQQTPARHAAIASVIVIATQVPLVARAFPETLLKENAYLSSKSPTWKWNLVIAMGSYCSRTNFVLFPFLYFLKFYFKS